MIIRNIQHFSGIELTKSSNTNSWFLTFLLTLLSKVSKSERSFIGNDSIKLSMALNFWVLSLVSSASILSLETKSVSRFSLIDISSCLLSDSWLFVKVADIIRQYLSCPRIWAIVELLLNVSWSGRSGLANGDEWWIGGGDFCNSSTIRGLLFDLEATIGNKMKTF